MGVGWGGWGGGGVLALDEPDSLRTIAHPAKPAPGPSIWNGGRVNLARRHRQ